MSIISKIDASAFEDAAYYYEEEFKSILNKIFLCYCKLVANKQFVSNDENMIRDYLYINYLNNPTVRNELELFYHFECEPKEFGISSGFIDIKVFNQNIFHNPSQYFIIECKRLDNFNKKTKNGLNGKYIKDGIMRFVDRKYSLFNRINGMLGFVVEKLSIQKNVEDINYLLNHVFYESQTINSLKKIEGSKSLYFSIHNDSQGVKFKLYHLMLDFSNNMMTN